MLMRRCDWELVEYYLEMDKYKKEHGLCEQTKKQPLISSTNTDECDPNTGLPVWWLSRAKKGQMEQGYVTERRAGRYLERRVVSHQATGGYISKLPHETIPFDLDDEGNPVILKPYVLRQDLRLEVYPIPDGGFFTGIYHVAYDYADVRFMNTQTSRQMDMKSVKRTCENFKWLIRANERKVRLFVTLTYAENMTDTKRLYEDFRKFWQALKRKYLDIDGYLVAFEPQKRGAWHAHMLLISENPFLKIPNKIIHELWNHGFTKTQSCRNIHDLGTYLTAYLTNMKSGRKTKKGARLYMYPAGFHFARHSRNGISYVDTSRWFGGYNVVRDLDKMDLIYDYENTRRVGDDGSYITSKILCLCRKEEFS